MTPFPANRFVLALLFCLSCTQSAFKQADDSVSRGRFQQAVETLRTYYLEHPTSESSAEALWRIANIYRLHLKEFNKAADTYRILIERFPQTQAAHQAQWILAQMFVQQFQDYQQAIVELQKVVLGQNYSELERAQARLETGDAYYALSNFSQARIEYEGVRQLLPESIEAKRALLQLAHTYDAEENYDNALALFKQVAELAPLPAGNTDAEKAAAQTVLELIQQGKFYGAGCLAELGHYDEALQGYLEIRQTYPSPRVVETRIERLKERMRQVKK